MSTTTPHLDAAPSTWTPDPAESSPEPPGLDDKPGNQNRRPRAVADHPTPPLGGGGRGPHLLEPLLQLQEAKTESVLAPKPAIGGDRHARIDAAIPFVDQL